MAVVVVVFLIIDLVILDLVVKKSPTDVCIDSSVSPPNPNSKVGSIGSIGFVSVSISGNSGFDSVVSVCVNNGFGSVVSVCVNKSAIPTSSGCVNGVSFVSNGPNAVIVLLCLKISLLFSSSFCKWFILFFNCFIKIL